MNTGTPGAPKFGPLVPFKGTIPYPSIVRPYEWDISRYRPDGEPNELLDCTNASVEPGFSPPPDSFHGKGSLKFSIVKPNNVYFKKAYQSANETRYIAYQSAVQIEVDTQSVLTLWVRTDGDISNLTWHMEGTQGVGDPETTTWHRYTGSSLGESGSWIQVKTDIRIPTTVAENPEQKQETGTFTFWLTFQGDGTLYLDDISLKKAN